MSDLDVKAVSGTGTFAVLNPTAGADDTDTEAQAGRDSALQAPANTDPAPANTDLEQLTAKLNLASETIGRDLRFQVDMESGRSVIQVLDRDTGEIIRQIPPEKAEVTLTSNGFVELRLYDESA